MSRRALLLFAAMCVIWGIPYLFIRVAVHEMSPAVLVFSRTLLGAAILLPIALARREVLPALVRWRPLLLFAALEIAIPWLALSSAEEHISSSLAGLLIAAVPLVTTVASPLVGNKEHLGPLNIAGLAVGFAGVAAIVGFDFQSSGVLPLLEMAAVVVGYSVAPAVLVKYLAGVPSMGVTAVALTVCALGYAPVAALTWPAAAPGLDGVAAVVVLAVVCTAVGFLCFFALIGEVGAVRATVITYINPAVAAVLGIAVLRESFTIGMGIGFVLVLAGSVLATRRAHAMPAPEPAELAVSGGPR
ncbi:MAG TPA: DMT family transporter [Candidatus Dormibacteraeota bacterium]|nr:DMT family transporter [Candidatus Dormibacteraeota bacterium]